MAQKQFIIDGGFNTNADSQITGNLSMTGSVLPTVDSNGVTGYDLGSPTAKWRDLYLSQGSLYIDGQKVLQSDSGTIVVKADPDQGMSIRTEGTGVLTLQSPNPLAVAATLQMAAGKKITDASGTAVVFGDKIDADFNQVINVGAPTANAHAATKFYVDDAISNLVNGAGAALDTLNELAAALGNDANFSTTISTQLATKATVVALDAEIARATAAEGVNAAAISDEISARVTAVSNEASARTSADAGLQTQIDNEVTARTAADSALADDIAAEATARAAAVTAEATARADADTTLQGNIDAEATARAAAITSVESQIASVNSAVSLLTNYHSAPVSITSAQATTNATATVAVTFAEMSGWKSYAVFLNRQLLRPTEATASGTTVTFAVGVLATDDEVEVIGLKG